MFPGDQPCDFDEIRVVTEQASGRGVIFLAAASNSGSLYPDRRVAFPARMYGHVLSIRSATGQSERFDASPFPSAGEGLEAASIEGPPKSNFFSGTSFATPVAAGVAALVLEFSIQRDGHVPNVDKVTQQNLWSYRGMRKVFRHMCSVSDHTHVNDCDMVVPWQLFDEYNKEDVKIADDIVWLMEKL